MTAWPPDRGGAAATATDAVVADLGIRGGRIATIDQGLPAGGPEVDARGLVVVPAASTFTPTLTSTWAVRGQTISSRAPRQRPAAA